MQIKIKFTSNKDIVLPIHYNYILQAFIYNNIDENLANFLHDEGYTSNGRNFKFFTFSRIFQRGKKIGDNFNFGNKLAIIVSSPLEIFCKSIANHMLQNDNLYIGKNQIKTEQIQVYDYSIDKDAIIVETLSPVVAYSTLFKEDGSKYTCYFGAYESDFNRIVSENLIRKYNALYGANLAFEDGIQIEPIGDSRMNFTYYKNFIIKGASGKFKIKGHKELLQLGIDSGLGSKNSQGFGCIKVL